MTAGTVVSRIMVLLIPATLLLPAPYPYTRIVGPIVCWSVGTKVEEAALSGALAP